MHILISNILYKILKKRSFWAITYLGTYASFAFCSSQADIYLEQVVKEPTRRTEIALFMDNVLRQVNSETVFDVIDSFNNNTQSNDKLYAYLLQHINQIQPRLSLYSQFKALQFQKSILSEQALQLLNSKKTIG